MCPYFLSPECKKHRALLDSLPGWLKSKLAPECRPGIRTARPCRLAVYRISLMATPYMTKHLNPEPETLNPSPKHQHAINAFMIFSVRAQAVGICIGFRVPSLGSLAPQPDFYRLVSLLACLLLLLPRLRRCGVTDQKLCLL